jgi:hypothetical protein
MPLAEKGVRGKAAGLAPPQHTEAPERDQRSEYYDFGLGPRPRALMSFARVASVVFDRILKNVGGRFAAWQNLSMD